MIPTYIKYLTVSQNEDLTYNIVCIADMSDGINTYENCELIIPKAVTINNNLLSFPYYNEEGESIITITIPGGE